MRIVKAGMLYFAVAFGAGFLLGTIRVPFLVPRLGERWAELIETPFMLVAIVVASRWVVRKLAVPPTVPARLGMGLIAVALLLAVEFTVVLELRGLTMATYFAGRDPVAGAVYYSMLALFTILPLLVRGK